MDEAQKKRSEALAVFETLCKQLDSYQWHYDKDEETLKVSFDLTGDIMPIHYNIRVDEERSLLRVASRLAFKMSEDKRVEGAIAACEASYRMVDGSFDYDISDGEIVFRVVVAYMGSLIGSGAIRYIIGLTNSMVEQYTDSFFAINKGMMSIEDFLAKK